MHQLHHAKEWNLKDLPGFCHTAPTGFCGWQVAHPWRLLPTAQKWFHLSVAFEICHCFENSCPHGWMVQSTFHRIPSVVLKGRHRSKHGNMLKRFPAPRDACCAFPESSLSENGNAIHHHSDFSAICLSHPCSNNKLKKLLQTEEVLSQGIGSQLAAQKISVTFSYIKSSGVLLSRQGDKVLLQCSACPGKRSVTGLHQISWAAEPLEIHMNTPAPILPSKVEQWGMGSLLIFH